MPDANETTISIDHGEKVAHIWTRNRRVKTRLRKIHAEKTQEWGGGAWYTLPELGILFRKPRKILSSGRTRGNPEALRAWRQRKAKEDANGQR